MASNPVIATLSSAAKFWLLLGQAGGAELNVISVGTVSAAVTQLAPQFEKDCEVKLRFGNPKVTRDRLFNEPDADAQSSTHPF